MAWDVHRSEEIPPEMWFVPNEQPVRTPLGEMPIAKCPGEIVGCDLMGPLLDSGIRVERMRMGAMAGRKWD